jgi:hypothetical protein
VLHSYYRESAVPSFIPGTASRALKTNTVGDRTSKYGTGCDRTCEYGTGCDRTA